MKCFYHGDRDGQCSAFWVSLNVGIKNTQQPIDFIEINHGDKFPMNRILKDEQIWIVDYSISTEEMKELLSITKDVTWIDHHISAIEKYNDFPYEIRGIRYNSDIISEKVAGCELTYAYIHKMTSRGEGDIKPFTLDMLDDCPMFTRYIGDRDVWRYTFGKDTTYFCSGMEMRNYDPSSEDWFIALEEPEAILNDGKLIERYKSQNRQDIVSKWAYEVEFEGHKILVCNSTDKTSELFGDKFYQYDFVSIYCYDGKNKCYSVSLYSDKMDVLPIALKYGGGGHNKACGFVCEKLPY